jgi:hypothetical protein
MDADDTRHGSLAISERERQPVGHVQLDRQHVGGIFITVEDAGLNLLLAPHLRHAKPVHAVDYAHGLAVHGYRRQPPLHLGKSTHVPSVLTGTPGRARYI